MHTAHIKKRTGLAPALLRLFSVRHRYGLRTRRRFPLHKGYLCFPCEVMVYLKLHALHNEFCWKLEEMSPWVFVLIKTKLEIAKSTVNKCACHILLFPFPVLSLFSKRFGRSYEAHSSDFTQVSSAYCESIC